MGGKVLDNRAITKLQAIIIAVIVVVAAIAGAVYYYYSTLPKSVKVVAIAHAAPGIQALAEDFMKEYPNIKIEVLLFDWETGRDRQLHDMAVKAGEFDVYMWDCIYTGAFAPHLYTLDELKSAYSDAEIFKDYADFIESVDQRYAHWNGKRIGYVVCTNVMAMFYRKDLFESAEMKDKYRSWISGHYNEIKSIIEECGLNAGKIPQTLVVPTTLEELVAVARFFTKKFNPDSPTEIGNTIMAMRTHTIHWEYCWLFAQWRRSPEGIATCGPITLPWGDLFTSDGRPAFDPAITNMGIGILKLFKYLTEYQTAPMETEWSQCMEHFGRGRAAMWAGSWASVFIDFVVKAAEEYPEIAGKVGVAKSPGVGIDGTWQVGVSKYSKNPREAWLFCQYMMRRESMIKAWETASSFPVRKSVIQELSSQYPVFSIFLEALRDPGTRTYVPENPELEDSIAKWVTSYIAGEVDAETTINNLVAEWKYILRAYLGE
ncbi:MAG: extracellular solute-binding protein [Candidatus Bathyarchaeia archaeon]